MFRNVAKQLWRAVWSTGLAISLAAAASGAEQQASARCALLDLSRSPVGALVEAKLLAMPGLVWVERTEIGRVRQVPDGPAPSPMGFVHPAGTAAGRKETRDRDQSHPCQRRLDGVRSRNARLDDSNALVRAENEGCLETSAGNGTSVNILWPVPRQMCQSRDGV